MDRRLFSASAALALVAASGLAVAQHQHGSGGEEPPMRYKGPNITTVATRRYVPQTGLATNYPTLPRTMSDGTVRKGPVVQPPGPPVNPGPAPAKGTGKPAKSQVPMGGWLNTALATLA